MSYVQGSKDGIVNIGAVKWHKKDENVMMFTSKNARNSFLWNTLTELSGRIIFADPRKYIDIDMHIEDIEKINYCFYRNDSSVSNTWYCCFVDSWDYIAPQTTRLYLSLDVFQQYFYDCTFYRSYIERAHIPKSKDIIGAYTQNEPIGGELYISNELLNFSNDLRPYYVLHCLGTISIDDKGNSFVSPYNEICGGIGNNLCLGSATLNKLQSAIQQYADLQTDVLFFNIPKDGRENCQYIQIVPSFTANGDYIDPSSQSINLNRAFPTSVDKEYSFTYNTTTMANGYTPKNKKLFTSQYQQINLVTRNGALFTFRPELFNTFNNINCILRGSCGGSGVFTFIMNNYKGLDGDRFKKINYGGTISLGYDANNSASHINKTALSQLSDVMGFIGNVGGASVATALTNNPIIGSLSIASSANNLIEKTGENIESLVQSNIKQIGNTSNIDDIGLYTYATTLNITSIDKDTAESIDNFLTAYGYNLQEIQAVSEYINNRSSYNYIKVSNLNANLWCPTNDFNEFKTLFENGIRLWHTYENFGNLGVENN